MTTKSKAANRDGNVESYTNFEQVLNEAISAANTLRNDKLAENLTKLLLSCEERNYQ